MSFTYQKLEKLLEVAQEVYQQAKQNHKYTKTCNKARELEDKIEKLKEKHAKLIEKAEKQKAKYYEDMDKIPSTWGSVVLTGVAKELMELNPTLKHYEILGSFGLNCEYGLWLFTEEDYKLFKETNSTKHITYSLNFQNHSMVWTGEMCKKYAKGTIGEMNGGNMVCIPIESIEQLNKIMHELKDKSLT